MREGICPVSRADLSYFLLTINMYCPRNISDRLLAESAQALNCVIKEINMSDYTLIPDQKPDRSLLSPLLTENKEHKAELRIKSNQFVIKSVHKADLDEYVSKGWELFKTNKTNLKIRKLKSHDVLLEDRVWCLFERMGYKDMNGDKFNISFIREDESKGKKQIDVFACDEETAIVVECKSKEVRGRRTLQKDLHETICLKEYIAL
jgi:DNA sulfur modification protein DndB